MGNSGQAAFWDGVVGDSWVRNFDDYDRTLEPFGTAVLDLIEPGSGDRVLDVGCGVGSTSLDLARRVAPGQVLGLDISHKMLNEARRHQEEQGVDNLRFVQGDAQTADLGPDPFDVVFSRLGVMFFADPVAAFTNMRSSMERGRLGFVSFQPAMKNQFIVIPVLAGSQHLELPRLPHSDGPGPFSLADPERINSILSAANFTDIKIAPGPDEACLFDADDLPALAGRVLEQNPVTVVAMQTASHAARAAAIDATAQALAEHRQGDVVRLGAGTWVVTATAGN